MQARDEIAPTEVFETVDAFVPPPGCTYIHGHSVEARSAHVEGWKTRTKDVLFVDITQQGRGEVKANIADREITVLLRSPIQLSSLLADSARCVYLDITGLEHQVWAPLLKASIQNRRSTAVVYVEPESYAFSRAPTEGQIFDLSQEIRGIEPLPGFASFGQMAAKEDCFVPLLGFEGTRLRYVIEQVQPAADRIFPIVGVPGFRLEYPFHTFLGNKSALAETGAWGGLEYAQANCPFSLYYKLESISKRRPKGTMRVAPIGTKPHGVGAVLFKICSRRSVELVYDHPVRAPKRTKGTDRLFVYHVSGLAGVGT